MDSFFASDLFRLGSVLLGIVISAAVTIGQLKEKSPAKIVEAITLFTFGITGFASITSFVMHFFFADMVAVSIGWPVGSPFQTEVAGANLAVGLLGVLCFSRRDFWLPYAISKSAFLIIAGITHVIDLINHQNFSVGNAGLTLYMDFIWPMIYFGLLLLLKRYSTAAPAGFTYTQPQL